MPSLTSVRAYEVIRQYYLLPVSSDPKTLMQRLSHITEGVMNVRIPGISQEWIYPGCPRSEPGILTCIASCISVRNISAKVSVSDFDIYPEKYVYPLVTAYPHGVRFTAAHTSSNATLADKHSNPRNKGIKKNLRAHLNATHFCRGKMKNKTRNRPHINASTRFIYCTKKSPIVVRLYIYNNAFIQLFLFTRQEKEGKKMNLYKTNWQNAVSVIGGSTHDVDEHDVVL